MKKLLSVLLCAALLCLAFAALPYAEEAAPLKFVVLGDSIAEGGGAILSRNAYAQRIARDRGYTLQNFGKGGDTSAAMLHKVTQDADIRRAIREADIIEISIGGNDFYPSLYLIATGLLGETSWMEPRRAVLRANFTAAMDELRALKKKDALLIVQTLYNPVFSFMPPSANGLYEEIVSGVNDIIRGYLTAHPGAYRIADVYAAFQGRHGLVFVDMTHPSGIGHDVIAAVVAATIDGTAPPSPLAIDRTLDSLVMRLQPLILIADKGIVGVVQFVHDRLPSVWARLMEL